MKLFTKITKPNLLPHWSQDLTVTILRIACGNLLAFNFGSDKFGMPWSPIDKNLGFFEVAFWFTNDVASYGGIFGVTLVFFAWMGSFQKKMADCFYCLDFKLLLPIS